MTIEANKEQAGKAETHVAPLAKKE